jgi:hypothetical protein
MLFASSRDALRRSLVGIAAEIQGTELSEVEHESGKSFSQLTSAVQNVANRSIQYWTKCLGEPEAS